MVTSDFVSLERGLPPGGAPIPSFNVAVARKVLTLVYHGLRDGEIRCLRDRQAA